MKIAPTHGIDYEIFLGSVGTINRQLNEGLSLYLILQGHIYVEMNGQRPLMRQDSCFCINNGDVYGLSSDCTNVVLGIHFSIRYLKEECPELLKYTYRCDESREEAYASLKKNIADTAFCYLKKEEGAELMFKSSLFKMLYLLQQYFRLEEIQTSGEDKIKDDRILNILNYIQKNYKYRISLQELAEKEYMSIQYLSKIFQRKMGVNLSRYISILRLESAIKELIYTDSGITQIALGNGFASAKSFNVQFKKAYKVLPSEYRKQNKLAVCTHKDNLSFSALKRGESFDILVRYLSIYNQDHKSTKTLSIDTDMNNKKNNYIYQYAKILNIGDFDKSLRWDVRSQMICATEKIKFDYIYFYHFFSKSKGSGSNYDVFRLTDCIESFRFFRQLNLMPFIRIDISEVYSMAEKDSMAEVYSELTILLSEIRQAYGMDNRLPWKFDITGTAEELRYYYLPIRKSILKAIAHAHTGIHLEFRSGWKGELADFLRGLPVAHLQFISFDMDLNSIQVPSNANEFARCCHHQARDKVTQMNEILSKSGIIPCSIYLIDWNVLTGKTLLEAGEFHRSALIADQLVEISSCVNGVGMALNLMNPYARKAKSDLFTYSLSLFLYKTVKRNLFFVAGFLDSFREYLVYSDEHVICTAESGKDAIYTFFLHNPRYMDPFDSLDNLRTKNYDISLSIKCINLIPGHYRIKKTILNRDSGSTYLKLLKGEGSQALNIEEFDEYLENSVYPEVVLYEAELSDTFTFFQDLSLNSVAFYVMKKLH